MHRLPWPASYSSGTIAKSGRRVNRLLGRKIAYSRRLRDVFPRVVRAADERTGLDVAEAEPERDPLELRELGGRQVALHRQVVSARLQVLSEGDGVGAGGRQAAEGGHYRRP